MTNPANKVRESPISRDLMLAVLMYLTTNGGQQARESEAPRPAINVLGALDVRDGDKPIAVAGTKPRAILTLLGLHAGQIVAADTLIAALWGDDPPRTVTKALQTYVSTLRSSLGDGIVLTQGPGWKLAATTDATRFDRAAAAGRDALRGGDPHAAAEQFTKALRLWRGHPVLPDTARGRSEIVRWTEQVETLVDDRTDALLACGQAAELIGTLEQAVTDTPLRERRWAQLMLAHYRAGRQGDALSAYHRIRTRLIDQLGVAPGPELRRLQAAILAHHPALDDHHRRPERALTLVTSAA